MVNGMCMACAWHVLGGVRMCQRRARRARGVLASDAGWMWNRVDAPRVSTLRVACSLTPHLPQAQQLRCGCLNSYFSLM